MSRAKQPERTIAWAPRLSWPHQGFRLGELWFPMNQQTARYYYLARNGIYHLAGLWGLSGQEVLFPAYCHGVDLAALEAAGVDVRFYPVHRNGRVCAGEIERLMTRRTKAIYLIHYLGFPGPVEELREVCDRRGVRLMEDCALALLSQLGDKPLGSFGDAALFCLYKTLAVPHGGILLVREGSRDLPRTSSPSLSSTLAYSASALWQNVHFDEQAGKHRLLRVVRERVRKHSGTLGVSPVARPEFELAQVHLGMSRLCQWLASHQDWERIVEVRRRNFLRLFERIGDLIAPVFGELGPGVCPQSYPISRPRKQEWIEQLFARGVDCVDFWARTPPGIRAGEFPEVDELRRTVLEIPTHQDLTVQDMDWIADQVREVWNALEYPAKDRVSA